MSSRVCILVGFVTCYSSTNGSTPTCTPDVDANACGLEANTDTSCKPIQSKWYLPSYVKMQLTRYHADCPVSSVFHAQYNTQHITHSDFQTMQSSPAYDKILQAANRDSCTFTYYYRIPGPERRKQSHQGMWFLC